MATHSPTERASVAVDLAALQRALEHGIHARRDGIDTWQATRSGNPGDYAYWVTVQDGELRCTCKAGGLGRSCKHAALVAVLIASGAVPATGYEGGEPTIPHGFEDHKCSPATCPWRYPAEPEDLPF